MAGFLTALPGIISGAGALASLFGGKSKGQETVSKEPAQWDDEAQKAIYDLWTGGMLDPENTLSDRFTQDDTQQRDTYGNYIGNLDRNTAGYIDTLKSVGNMMGDSKVSGTIGGNQINIVPKATRQSVDDIMGIADRILGATETQEGRRLQYGTEMTPNRAYFNYLDYLKDPSMQFLSNRYNIPSQTAEAEYNAPFSQRIGDAAKMLTPLFDMNKQNNYNSWDPQFSGTRSVE